MCMCVKSNIELVRVGEGRCLSVTGQCVNHGSADPDSSSPERETLEDVRATPHTSVHIDLYSHSLLAMCVAGFKSKSL